MKTIDTFARLACVAAALLTLRNRLRSALGWAVGLGLAGLAHCPAQSFRIESFQLDAQSRPSLIVPVDTNSYYRLLSGEGISNLHTVAALSYSNTSFKLPPLAFERNEGQFAADVAFVARRSGCQLFLAQTEAVMVIFEPRSNATSKLVSSRTPAEDWEAGGQARAKPKPARRSALAGARVLRMQLVQGECRALGARRERACRQGELFHWQ